MVCEDGTFPRHDNRFSWSDKGRADTPLHGNKFAVLGEVPFGVVSKHRNEVSTMSRFRH